ncbi:MAG: bifunctional adenosylcobinamide kinase/adenosylcobinamide-phosphate guanylyltransferase [Clostridiales bacterium]|nr:bifunctional adenosylcobinamide kinase/adenosylcobinamide-phosphate guanylyltransferase [Clostridiales bacterium]
MTHLVSGGSGSGKSAWAEDLVIHTLQKYRYYLATMSAEGKEAQERIERHRRLRAGKGFVTMECSYALESLTFPTAARENVILLEDISNLIANEQFKLGGTDEEIISRVWAGLRHLQSQCSEFILVTNEVCEDGVFYDADIERYLRLLARVNRELAAWADTVTEIVYGIALPLK